MANGVRFETPVKELEEVRSLLVQSRKHTANPMYRLIMKSDVPWGRALSSVAGFYRRVGLMSLVANNTLEYIAIAQRLALTR